MIGKLLGNRYEIVEQLGGGGMAIVYKGRDTILNRLVTIKVLRSEFNSDEDFVKRFRREAQAIASLSHPNIVSIYDVGRVDEVDYLVMEYVEGDNLKNLIRLHGPLTPARSAQIARQISDALEHAHENSIVHRDVKPQNILITRDGRAKLTDFGIAREATAATLTQTDAVMGSVHYLSPEQARGENTGPRSDIYSLGVVLYEMATGALPFQGDTPVGVALKHIQDEPPRPSLLNPAVPLSLEKVIARAMTKSPSGRYETARQMAQELEDIAGAGIKDPPRAEPDDEFATRVIPTVHRAAGDIQPAERDVRGRKRSKRWLWSALILLVLFAAGAAAFQFYFNIPEVTMPSVEGKTLDEAKSILRRQGIKKDPQVFLNYHPSVPENSVISQKPAEGDKIKVNHTVILYVSQGAELREVPSVIGHSFSNAKSMIERNDLNVAMPYQEGYSNEYAEGVVMDQEPKGGKLAKGSQVILHVSKGKQPVMHKLPDLTGLTLEKAKEELLKLKLILDENVNRVRSSSYLSGQVTDQSPAKNTEVEEGSEVHVTVSDGPGPEKRTKNVTVPFNDDKKEHKLRIVLNDVRGATEVFNGTVRNEKSVTKQITYYGKATVRVYVDEVLVDGDIPLD
ncbi:Stk1 family PASTA domain-containing Ser/Thr kinase [Pelotomaculum sp. PtaB.Bin117]|uniref:Stk1 family PASTA domain-containing Ser/Thr kinase n=1 Tax=Pelotomaculum sp. PtaB.Bin117 TaxID=1811694 RepID=UPI0009C89F73|nr:Stk1 family PASTA domain-containing Ser/Thr kinase [Pelotomaculum sp. PtaB.Bin117]OPX88887.1 MAG: Serine/threonine-protein kinase PrkC [Pelotomaculum sp. PtaB.Bin117]